MAAMTLPARRLPLAVLACAALLAGCAVTPASTLPATVPTSAQPSVSVPTESASPEVTPTIPMATEPATPEPSVADTGSTTGQPVDAQIAAQLMPGFMAYYAAVDQILQAGGKGAPTQAMKDTMAGDVLASWTKQAADYAAKGYKQTGSTSVESFSPGGVDKATGKATADFCANASGVTVTDASGKTIASADPSKRATGGTAHLVWSGGHWRVVKLEGLTPIASCP